MSARMNTLATLRGSIERIETHRRCDAPRVALGHAEADATLQGGLAVGAMHEVFAEGPAGRGGDGFCRGLAGRVTARRPLVWVRQDFAEIETGALSMSGLAELGLDPRLRRDGARRRCGNRVAHRRRCARLRCARRRRARALGRDEAVRSRGEPQAHAGGAGLRRHRPDAADGGGAVALDGRDAMDRARGAFAAGLARGARGARRVFDAELVRNRHGPVGRWIMEWKCDECLFSEPAAYPQPVAAAPADRPHQASAFGSNGARVKRFQAKWPPVRVKKTRQNKMTNPASSSPKTTTRWRSLRWTMRRRARSRCRPAARQCPRHLPANLSVFDADDVADAKTLERDRRLVRPLHAAGGARSAARAVSRHHRLRASVRRRSGAVADVVPRAGSPGFCRQCGNRRHLGLRAHADAAMPRAASSPMAGRRRRSAHCRCRRLARTRPSPLACAVPD